MNVLRTLGGGYLQSHKKASILKQAVVRGLADFFAVPPGGSSQVTMLACGLWFLDLTQPPWGPSCGGAPSWVLGLGDPGSLAGKLRGLMVFPQCASYMSLSLPFLATGVTWTTRSSSQLLTPSISSPSTVFLLRNLPGSLTKVGRNIKAHPPVHQGLGQPWVPSIPSHSHPSRSPTAPACP